MQVKSNQPNTNTQNPETTVHSILTSHTPFPSRAPVHSILTSSHPLILTSSHPQLIPYQMKAKDVVIAFWESMNTNDFEKASLWLSEDFQCFWPQSAEVIKGRENFEAINTNYPSQGKWQFEINAIVCEANQVVSDVSVTDGHIIARAITFHTIENGLISKQVEFWPDNYEAPEWRRKWVEIA